MVSIRSKVWPGGRGKESSKHRLLPDGSNGEIEYYYIERLAALGRSLALFSLIEGQQDVPGS